MDKDGEVLNWCKNDAFYTKIKFKILRSGYRNMQSSSMASVTSLINPIEGKTQLTPDIFEYSVANAGNHKVLNGAAIEYQSEWDLPNDSQIPFVPSEITTPYCSQDPEPILGVGFNPFIYNMEGEWRAKRSYTYLTGRTQDDNSLIRNSGYLTSFEPLYQMYLEGGKYKWKKETSLINGTNPDGRKWTFASEISKMSPFGAELENKDALGRYSSAIFGNNHTLPAAVAANAAYKEIAFDGFEDYEVLEKVNEAEDYKQHFGFKDQAENNVVDTQAHTGRRSIKVPPAQSLDLEYSLEECEEVLDFRCEEPFRIETIDNLVKRSELTGFTRFYMLEDTIGLNQNYIISMEPYVNLGTIHDEDVCYDIAYENITDNGKVEVIHETTTLIEGLSNKVSIEYEPLSLNLKVVETDDYAPIELRIQMTNSTGKT
ncbi:hypothetical protein, partial [Aureivirga marina]|uniref:hypothetical protein n=1 Tax=Aureivirga marina TaxID=1182451 RepID=UPI0018C95D05